MGSRRAAAEGLLRQARGEDEGYLLEALRGLPDSGRFALVQVLGAVGGEAALAVVLGLLDDPFARAEAAEAASRMALRLGRAGEVLPRLREPGLGSPWRWPARARLGDGAWAAALPKAWAGLAAPLRLQALEAARELPEALRQRLRNGLQPQADGAGPALRELWQQL